MRNSAGIVILLFILFSCGKSGNSPKPAEIKPAAAVLTFPAENAICTTGTVMSELQTSVIFTWNKADGADSYDLILKDLLTGKNTLQNTRADRLAITVLRNTPYSWSVVSRSDRSSLLTETADRKFYVAGLGKVNYSPFPADLIAPVFGKHLLPGTKTVDLLWSGSDVDSDIAGYTVYFSETEPPGLLKAGVREVSLNAVPVESGKTYYWRVVTIDGLGNTSESTLFKFTVD